MTAGGSTCTPVLVGGQVFGSVLVLHSERPGAVERRLMGESVTQAAPVLANLRNLARAEERALTDAVTGLPNRRAVAEQLESLVARGRRTGEPVALIMADIDHFKRVNYTYGHDKGDDVLGSIAIVLRSTLRESDFVGRFGGEEFLLLLPDTDHLGALAAAAKLHNMIGKSHMPGLDEPVTCSFGVAAFPQHAPDSETLLRRRRPGPLPCQGERAQSRGVGGGDRAHAQLTARALGRRSTPRGNRTPATSVKGWRANRYTMGAGR